MTVAPAIMTPPPSPSAPASTGMVFLAGATSGMLLGMCTCVFAYLAYKYYRVRFPHGHRESVLCSESLKDMEHEMSPDGSQGNHSHDSGHSGRSFEHHNHNNNHHHHHASANNGNAGSAGGNGGNGNGHSNGHDLCASASYLSSTHSPHSHNQYHPPTLQAITPSSMGGRRPSDEYSLSPHPRGKHSLQQAHGSLYSIASPLNPNPRVPAVFTPLQDSVHNNTVSFADSLTGPSGKGKRPAATAAAAAVAAGAPPGPPPGPPPPMQQQQQQAPSRTNELGAIAWANSDVAASPTTAGGFFPHANSYGGASEGSPENSGNSATIALQPGKALPDVNAPDVTEEQQRPPSAVPSAGNSPLQRTEVPYLAASTSASPQGSVSFREDSSPSGYSPAHPKRGSVCFPDSAADPMEKSDRLDYSGSFVRTRRASMSPRQSISRKRAATMCQGWRRARVLGTGMSGQVVLGVRSDGSLMAVKVMDIGNIPDQKAIQSLCNEVDILAKYSHENIVDYYGHHVDNERKELHIFMEYVSNGSLGGLVRSMDEPLSERAAAEYTAQILAGVAYLHSNQVMHRDIKGDNILMHQDATIKISDFGMSKSLGEVLGGGEQSYQAQGTPLWSAPEVFKDRGYDLKSDIWSVGCVVVELLTGRPPWQTFETVWSAISTIGKCTSFPPLMPVSPQVSGPCEDFLRQCLNPLPEKRLMARELMEHPWILSNMDDADSMSDSDDEDPDADGQLFRKISQIHTPLNPKDMKFPGQFKRPKGRLSSAAALQYASMNLGDPQLPVGEGESPPLGPRPGRSLTPLSNEGDDSSTP